MVLSELSELGKIGSGSHIMMVGFGGGRTWGAALAEFK